MGIQQPTWDQLMEWLHSANPNDRCNAMDYLGSRSEPEAYDLLMQALDNDNEEQRVRAAAARGLGWQGDKRAVDRLIRELLDENSDIRAYAAEALWQIGDARAMEPLISVLDDDSVDIRWFATMALGKMPHPRALEALMKRLDDPNEYVRFDAVGAVARQALALGVDVRPILRRIVAEDPAERVRQGAAMHLMDFGDMEAAEKFWGKGIGEYYLNKVKQG